VSNKLGVAGSFIIGGSHVGWAETTITLVATAVSPSVLTQVLNNTALNNARRNNLHPVARIYLEAVGTGERTQVIGVTSFSIRQNKRSSKGSFSVTIADAVTNNQRTTTYLDMLSSTNAFLLVIEAGYRVDGVDYYTQIFKGVKTRIDENYGKASNSITVTGFDLTDNLERVDGIVSAYSGGAKALIMQLLNEANFNSYDLRFTDFNLVAQDFNQETALQVIELISKRYGILHHYVEGDGTFVMTTPSAETTAKYSYNADQNIFTLTWTDDVTGRINQLRLSGQGIFIIREDTGDKAIYGLRKGDHQNNLIQNQLQAETAADEIIYDSQKKEIRFQIPFNPFIYIDTVLNVTHTAAGISVQKVRVSGLTHSLSTTENSISFSTFVEAEVIPDSVNPLTTIEVVP
jgi:hypothetical protein